MSDRIGLDLIARARQRTDPTSGRELPGGEKITKGRELTPIMEEFLKAEGAKPKGRLSQTAIDAILSLREDEGASVAARDYIKRLKTEAPTLLWRADQPTGVISIRPGHASLPVFINRDGWAVPNATIDGQPRDAKT